MGCSFYASLLAADALVEQLLNKLAQPLDLVSQRLSLPSVVLARAVVRAVVPAVLGRPVSVAAVRLDIARVPVATLYGERI